MRNQAPTSTKTVLILSWFYRPFVGGAELFVEAMTSRLSDRYRFVILTARMSRHLKRREQRGNVEVIRCGLGNRWDKHLYPVFATPAALGQIRRVDIVHTVMVNAAAVVARGLRVFARRPSLLTLQMGDDDAYVRRSLGILFPVYPWLHRGFDRVHAISSFLRERAVRFGVEAERISIVPNGVDLEHFHVGPAHGKEPDGTELRDSLGLGTGPVVVSVSRLAQKNGLDTLVASWPRIRRARPDAVLLILGDGEQRPTLERMIRDMSLEGAIRMVGSIEHLETPRYLRVADVFARPSRSEGLGNAFLEAMACGVPVVATPVGGIVDFVEDGKTGLLCPPDQPDALAEAILRLLSEPELARRITSLAKELVENHYSWDRVAEALDATYRELSP